jgi:hypothetical protein
MKPISKHVIRLVRQPASVLERRLAGQLVLALALVAWGGTALRGQEIVVPNALAEQDGNTASTTPGDDNQTGIRIQYMLDASQFQALSDPAYLTGFAMRPDSTPGPSGPKTITVQVYASTTTRALAQMSTQFSGNIGADRTLLFDGTLTLSSENLPGPGNTRQFDYAYPLTTPFLYDPAAGNLVMDLHIAHAEGPSMRFDSVTDSPVVRNLSSPNAPTATSGQFFEAPVLKFTFESAPAITIRASQVEICWTSVAEATYRVEWSSDLSNGEWTPLIDCIGSTGELTCVQDAVPPGGPRRFYRVVPTTCEPE